jgi:LmbE family N-acetylglucosaminyl deacetylase
MAHTVTEQETPIPRKPPVIVKNAPVALIFSPHPDDECIIGGLPLRLLRETGWNVINVAVTLGSYKARQPERWRELNNACAYLAYQLLATAANGLERINLPNRERDPAHWSAAVNVITAILETQQPAVMFIPHAADWNSTHIGTHYLIRDALSRMPSEFACYVVETEYWGAMPSPNLMVESSSEQLTDLVTALSLHDGEVARNPYHLRLPAWMIDNVRRGSEVVNGQRATAPDFIFATLYRLCRWADGEIQPVANRPGNLACADRPDKFFSG